MNEVSTQGMLDAFFLDKATVEKVKEIISAIDVDKIKMVLDTIERDEEGWLCLKIDLRVKK
jgi:hypothetical protein